MALSCCKGGQLTKGIFFIIKLVGWCKILSNYVKFKEVQKKRGDKKWKSNLGG